jgi:hypothetical protein
MKIKKHENTKIWKHGNAKVENADRVLATVKHSALNAVFPVTLRSQFPNLGQPKNSIEIQLFFSHLIIDQHRI